MPKTEDGEYELILGSRQLLSMFFIVVVLLGAGFTLGYMMGRETSTAPAAVATNKPDAAPVTLPDPVDDPIPSTSATTPSTETASLKPSAAPAETKSEPPARAAESLAYRTGVPPSGSTFLQVAAVGKQDAEMQAKSLSGKGFPMWVAPNDKNPDLFSVMVGPYRERADLAKAKAALEDLGFRKTFRKDFK